MQTALLILIIAATIVTTIVNFAKPAYQDIAGKYAITINILLSFGLGVAWAFAVRPYLELQLTDVAVILVGLAIGTWATVFYDILKLIQKAGSTKKKEEDGACELIGYVLDSNEEEKDGQSI